MKSTMKTEIAGPPKRLIALLQLVICLIPACLGLFLMSTAVLAQDKATPTPTNAPPSKVQKKARKELTGAELYAINCNRCHPERYAPERTEEQWKTIILHMRTRANIPAAQARAILKYLQEDSGK
jgi:mono/diheme cytochrome c family protein